MSQSIDALNERFGIPNQVRVESGPGDLPVVAIRNKHAEAQICLLGGHVLRFQPHGAQPVLWVSERSPFEVGKAIRGGIPICWPWFGPHPTDSDKPSHGFARTTLWDLDDTRALDDGATQVTLSYRNNAVTQALWPHAFELRCVVTVSTRLTVELITRNLGNTPLTYTGALHSYFTVGDSRQITIGRAGRQSVPRQNRRHGAQIAARPH